MNGDPCPSCGYGSMTEIEGDQRRCPECAEVIPARSVVVPMPLIKDDSSLANRLLFVGFSLWVIQAFLSVSPAIRSAMFLAAGAAMLGGAGLLIARRMAIAKGVEVPGRVRAAVTADAIWYWKDGARSGGTSLMSERGERHEVLLRTRRFRWPELVVRERDTKGEILGFPVEVTVQDFETISDRIRALGREAEPDR